MPTSARAQSCIWWVFCVCNNFVLDSFHHYACPALHVAWDFNSSNFPRLLLWIPKTGELSNCRKYVSCKTLPILEWLGPLKFTPVKFGGVGSWMVDKPQISYVVDSWTLSFKIKVKIKVKEHLYNFVYHFMDEFATVCTKELCFSLAFHCQNLASLECIFDFIWHWGKPSMNLRLFTANDWFYQCSSLLWLLFSLIVNLRFVFHPAAKIIC